MANFDTPSVLGASREVWASVLEATEGLTEEQWSLPTSCPGWDVSDQVAHLSGVELMLLGEPAPEVAVDHLDHVVTPFHGMVEVWIEARRPIDARVRHHCRGVGTSNANTVRKSSRFLSSRFANWNLKELSVEPGRSRLYWG